MLVSLALALTVCVASAVMFWGWMGEGEWSSCRASARRQGADVF